MGSGCKAMEASSRKKNHCSKIMTSFQIIYQIDAFYLFQAVRRTWQEIGHVATQSSVGRE